MTRIEFNPNITSFNILNAYYLASLSDLVYQDLDKISDILKSRFGLVNYKLFESKATDTQAFIASNSVCVILVFRGTKTWANWMTNFNIPFESTAVGRVHSGFNRALDSVWNDIYDTIMSLKDKNQTLWVTGHSLGGALATLAVDRFTEENVELVNGLYTYGQPRVGNKEFADNFDRKMKRYTFRIVDDQDLVTKVPLPGYFHIGNEYFIDNEGAISNINNFWKWYCSASKSVDIRSSVDADKYRAQYPGGILDHDASYYIKYLYQNLQSKIKTSFLDYLNKK